MFESLDVFVTSLELSPSVKVLFNLGVYLIEIIIIVVLGIVVQTIIRNVIHKLSNSWKNRIGDRKADTLGVVLSSISGYTIWFIVVCCVLGVFKIPIQSVLAVAGLGSVALGFGAQSLVKDFITGFFILLEDQFGVGDLVTLEGKTGIVEAIGMRTTRIRSFDGDVHIFPNSQIRFVTNMSKNFKRALVDINVSYNNDVDKILSVLKNEMENAKGQLPQLLSDPIVMGIVELKENSMCIRIVVDCQVGESYAVEREIRRLVKLRFDSEGISLRYPQVIFKEEDK